MSNGANISDHEYFSVSRDSIVSSSGSADQLRREAAKARKLADNAFGEAEKQRLQDVAASLDREAAAMENALAVKAATRPPIALAMQPVRSVVVRSFE